MDSITKAIARQYEAFPYPPVDPQWDKFIEFGDPSVYSPLLWPEGLPCKQLHILVAGCGTTQAARCAMRNPSCRVFGIDVSDAAIAAHKRLKDERNLHNLEVRRLDLREVQSLDLTFDLILSTGVLHHLERPEEGLRALAAVLERRGAMIIMLYGSAPRLGVYLLQDAFRRMGLAADHASVELVRMMLADLPVHHYFHWYNSHAPDLKSEAGLVDTLLHAQDRAYSVPQLFELITRCELQFQCWEDNYFYFPEGNVRPGTPLWQRIKAIPEREQWAVVENFMLSIGRHTFIACRPERHHRAINFASTEWLAYIPKHVPSLNVVEWTSSDPMQPRRCRRGRFEFTMDYAESLLFSSCDGRRTISQIIESSTLPAQSIAVREEFGRLFFERMWKLGHLWMLAVPQ